MKRAIKQDSGLWEVTAEIGREKLIQTALHRGLVIADQMNARSGKTHLVAICGAHMRQTASNVGSCQQHLCRARHCSFERLFALSAASCTQRSPFCRRVAWIR